MRYLYPPLPVCANYIHNSHIMHFNNMENVNKLLKYEADWKYYDYASHIVLRWVCERYQKIK